MTLEEKAEKSFEKARKRDIGLSYGSYFDGYIAGATENGIVWHDLRKNPEDLPKGKINMYLFGYVKNYSGKKPMIIAYNGEWFYDVNTYNTEVKVIAWCEIPVYPF